MWVSRIVLNFAMYSLIGWVWECLYCTICEGSWQNRGFLYGPVCPIYGVAAATISALYNMLTMQFGLPLPWWQIFLFGFLGSAVLEYGTSWILEKLFHAVWWDYTNMPLNINGRICLPASLVFGISGVAVIYLGVPATEQLFHMMPDPLIEGVALLIAMILGFDISLTVAALTDFEQKVDAVEDNINRHMEAFVSTLSGTVENVEQKIAEERERFGSITAESMVRTMSGAAKGALKRVVGFRPQIPGIKNMQLVKIAAYMKKLVRRKPEEPAD